MKVLHPLLIRFFVSPTCIILILWFNFLNKDSVKKFLIWVMTIRLARAHDSSRALKLARGFNFQARRTTPAERSNLKPLAPESRSVQLYCSLKFIRLPSPPRPRIELRIRAVTQLRATLREPHSFPPRFPHDACLVL
jgi:hypothetical protein